ncbi:hypothetical protein RYX41_01210 [Lactiplantibacillus plantarum]|nr:hypothetical protein [Lactiplantibacillus plantarum]
MANERFIQLNLDELASQYAGIIYYPQNLATELPILMRLYAQKCH